MTATAFATPFTSKALHHLDLERSAVQALERQDFRLAFALADRRCRLLPHAEGRVFLLRAEALYRLDLPEAARESVEHALALDPDDLIAARRMLAWGTGKAQLDAASTVAKLDADTDSVRTALLCLQQSGQGSFARVEPLDQEVTGWATWQGAEEVRLTLSSPGQAQSIPLIADRKHRFSARDRQATNFRVTRPPSTMAQRLQITQGDRVILDIQLPANRVAVRTAVLQSTRQDLAAGALPSLTVIVPVYRDLAATEVCLTSALAAVAATSDSRIIVVDDASPEPGIRSLLRRLAARSEVTLLINEQNLGFVGAVNRALGQARHGDIVLLNSDTVIPAQALNRLRATVRSSPDIGTATPLSNNGEYTSFPVANKSNPLPPPEQIEKLDRLASIANAGKVIDIPNGIGFCLYLTRECLDVVGELSDDFYRGYLEDVDLCLRVAEAGFRNVCVPSIFVGHAGARSFLGEKRSLVMRNLRILEQRFPRYAAECGTFLLADPLRDSRAALEREILSGIHGGDVHLILCGSEAVREISIGRCRQLSEAGKRGVVVQFQSDGGRLRAELVDPAGNVPQSIAFDVSTRESCEAFLNFLDDLAPRLLEVAEPGRIPRDVLTLARGRFDYDLLLTDTTLAASLDNEAGAHASWRGLLDGARHLIALDRRGSDFADAVLSLKARREISMPPRSASPRRRTGACLGILALRTSAQELQFIDELSNDLARAKPSAQIVVLGTTLNDLSLMRRPNVLVTGKLDAEEAEAVIEGYGISHVLLETGDPLFGHPLTAAVEASKLPIAAVEWTGSSRRARKMDLRLAPGAAPKDMTKALIDWLAAN